MLGTAGGIPISGRAQSGILLEEGEKKILMDCGLGVPLRLVEKGIDIEDIDIICLTHGHLDHIQDLPSLTKTSWLRTEEAEYEILLPPGLKDKLVDHWKVLDEYDRSDLDFRVMPPSDTFQIQDLSIQSFNTEHTEISQGYKISKSGKSVVYTGDTAPCDGVENYSQGADLLIHELSSLDRSEKHTDPKSLAYYLEDTGMKRLVLTHFYPETAEISRKLAENIQSKIDISTIAATDLQSFSINNR